MLLLASMFASCVRGTMMGPDPRHGRRGCRLVQAHVTLVILLRRGKGRKKCGKVPENLKAVEVRWSFAWESLTACFWRFLVLSGLLLQKIEGEPLDSFAEEYCSPVKLVHLPSGDSLWHTIFATDRFQQCPKRWMPHSWKVWRSSKRERRGTPP